MINQLFKIHYYKNSTKVRRRGYVMPGDLFTYGNYQYVLIGYHFPSGQIHLARHTTLDFIDMRIVTSDEIGCEWGKG